MKNTTIAGVSGYGKSLKHWRTRLYALFLTLCVPVGYGQTGAIGSGSVTGIRRNSWLFGALLLLSFLGGNTAFAQVNAYSFTQLAGTYTPITGGTVLWTGYDGFDDQSVAVTLPSAFTYQGVNYTAVTVSANGWVYIGTPGTTGNTPISSGYREIAPFAIDLDAKSASAGTGVPEVRWQQVDNEFIVQWSNVCRYTTSGATTTENINFQLRLNTTTGVIKVVYGACVDRVTPSTSYPQVGLGGGSTTVYNNRTIAAGGGNWINSTAGTANGNTMAFNGTTIPSNGLTYTWTPPSCAAPSGLASSAVTTTGATISWTAPGLGTPVDYQYEVRTSGAAGSGATGLVASGTATGISTAVTGLTANTAYSFYVRTNCGSGDFSAWSSAGTFATPCNSISSFPFTETFDTTSPSLGCWTATAGAGASYQWTPTTSDATYGAAAPAASARFAYLYVFLAQTTYNTYNYTSPSFDLGTEPKRLVYRYWLGNGGYTTTPVPLALQISVNGGAYTTIYSHTTANSTFATSASSPWQTNTIDLTAYAGSTVRFRYVSNSNYGGGSCDQGLDEVTVENIPSCAEPGAVTVSNVLTTSATATWVASASAPTSGYQYYVAPSGTTPTASTTPTGSVAAGVLTTPLTGLTANTTYIVWVRSNCGSATSPWTSSSTFYTGYCTPAPTSQDGNGITNFTLVNINNTTGSETGYYGNYSAQVANISVGTTASFSITYATGFTYDTKIWIDWNDDLDFNDAGENVYTGVSLAPNPTTLTGTFLVPTTVPLGNHRMRVGGVDTGPPTPCYNGSWGTFEDYTINAFMPPAPVVTGFTPASYCAASGVITITGTDLANATLSIGGTAVTPLTTNTNTQIVATVPAGVSGTVSVTTVAGTSTSATSFNVVAPATFTLSSTTATICNGATSAPVTITAGASAFDTYVWSPTTGVSGSAATGWTFNPTATTEYVLTASQSAGPCVVNATVNVTVNPLPNPITVTAASATTCLNQPVLLSATGGETFVPTTYCSPTVANVGVSGDYLNNFTFANITNNNSGDAASDYTYYSALTANVTGGSSYTISLQPGNPTWLQYFRVWIDYNQNGTFEDSESVYNSTVAINSSGTATGTVLVPATAYNGITRMRVLCSYNTLSTASQDCAWTGFGEYEDYNVNITGATSAVVYVWTPATGLYTNAAATVPYVAGAGATTVYAMPDATTTYSASSTTTLGCSVSGATTLTVNITAAPTAVSPQNFTSLTYASDLEATGTAIEWYTTATGGTPLAATDAVWSGTYYVAQTLNGCESLTRTPVVVSVILPEMDWVNLQWPPVLNITQGETADVYAQGYEPGVTPGAGPGYGVLAWVGVSSANTDPSTWTAWTPMTFNTQVGNNDEFVGAVGAGLAPGTYYYATRFKLVDGPFKYGGYSVEGGGFWNGTTYTSGVLTVTCGTEAPIAAATQTLCTAGTVAYLEATGTGIQWYATATGGVALSNNTALVSGATYYASQTVGCESLTRTAVTVTITTTPAPTALATQAFTEIGTVADLNAEGSDIQWYADATGGAPLDDATPLEDGVTYYASQTIDGCESPVRVAVTVSIVAYQLDFVNLQWPAEVTVIQGTDATIYAQVYEASVTPGAGPGIGVTVLVGISSDNTDPSTWTTWIPMTFNTQVGSNDEFMAMIGANLAPGTYYYAVAGQLYDGPYVYGGYSANGGGTWDGTVNVSGVINVICYTASPWAVEVQQVLCGSATIASLMAEGSNIQWYATATGSEPLAADTEITDGTVYYASQTVNGCESQQRIAVTAYISVVGTPTGAAVQEVSYTWNTVATVDDIVVEANGNITWYYTEADAVAGTNPIPAGTEIQSGTYYAVASYGDCSSAPFAVTVETVLDDGHFDLDAFSYWPNPVKDVLTMTYSEEITSVTVYNLLGQQVIALAPNATEVKIDMTALAEGPYTIHVGTGNTAETIRVVKKQ